MICFFVFSYFCNESSSFLSFKKFKSFYGSPPRFFVVQFTCKKDLTRFGFSERGKVQNQSKNSRNKANGIFHCRLSAFFCLFLQFFLDLFFSNSFLLAVNLLRTSSMPALACCCLIWSAARVASIFAAFLAASRHPWSSGT